MKRLNGTNRYVALVFLLLILCAVPLWGSPIQPNEVALVVNINDSTDTDNNGIFDWRDVISYYAEIHPTWDTNNVIQVRTTRFFPRSTYSCPATSNCNTLVNYNRMRWCSFHPDIDTLTSYNDQSYSGLVDSAGYDAGGWYNKPANHDYLLQKIAQWFAGDNHWNEEKWGDVKVLCLVNGMPLAMKTTCYYPCNRYDNCGVSQNQVNHSVEDAIMYFLHPGMENAGGFMKTEPGDTVRGMRPYYARAYGITSALRAAYATSTTDWDFVPGALSVTNTLPHVSSPGLGHSYWTNDVMPIYVMTCRLDGPNVNVIRAMIRRAAWPAARYNAETDSVEFNAVAVVDGSTDHDIWGHRETNPWMDPWSFNSIFRAGLIGTFGYANVFHDSLGGNTQGPVYAISQEMGCRNNPSPSDPVVFYRSSGTHNCTPSCASAQLRPRNEHYWSNGTLTFTIANGAITAPPESWSAVTVRDTNMCSPCDGGCAQCWEMTGSGCGRIVEALQAGFTYALGATSEPMTSGIASDTYIPKDMGIPNHQFIKVAAVAAQKMLWTNSMLGDPLGTWLDTNAPAPATISNVSFGLDDCCVNHVAFNATMPYVDDLDSLLIYVYLNGGSRQVAYADTVNISQVVAFSYTVADSCVDSVAAVVLDRSGNPARTSVTSMPEPSLTVTAPNGNELWRAGTVHNVTWTSQYLPAGDSVRIEVFTPGTQGTEVARVPASAGSFAWTVSGLYTSANRIRVSSLQCAPVQDSSNVYFSILLNTTQLHDSITMWAPCLIDQELWIDYSGKVVIKPLPNIADHKVTLAQNVQVRLGRSSWGPPTPHLWILGTEDAPILVGAVSENTRWDQIYLWDGSLTATYTTFKYSQYGIQAMLNGGTPVLQLDHCTVADVTNYLYWEGMAFDSCYARSCTFEYIGNEYGFGSVVLGWGDMKISACDFHHNGGYGLWLYDAFNTEITNCTFSQNAFGGLYTDGYASNVSIRCSEFSYNGGTTIPEVQVDASSFDFSDSARCRFQDAGGTLLSGTDLSSFILQNGANSFILDGGTGTYISVVSASGTRNISGNYWDPYKPTTPEFWSHMNPSQSTYWPFSSYLSGPEICGAWTGSLKTAPVAAVTPDDRRSLDDQRDNLNRAAGLAQPLTTAGVRELIARGADDGTVTRALAAYFRPSKTTGLEEKRSDFYQSIASTTAGLAAKKAAYELYLESLALEGNPQQALDGFEHLQLTAATRHDSIRAAIASMGLYVRFGEQHKLSGSIPGNRVQSVHEFVSRASRLLHPEITANPVQSVTSNPVSLPTQYRLYPNHPNPFNPVTEIRFDIPEASWVDLKIFNSLGQYVCTVVSEHRASGTYSVQWNGQDAHGQSVASGVYIYEMTAGSFKDSKKMLLMK